MAKKRRRGRNETGPSERSQELDRVLDRCDGSSGDEEFRRQLSRALAGFPGWLPHLVKRTRKGPAARRKAAVVALALSDTTAGREELQACLKHEASPAWLKRHALAFSGSLVSAEQAEQLQQELDVSDRDTLLRRAAQGERAAIELLIDEGEEVYLAELFNQDPRTAETISACLLDHQSAVAGRILSRAARAGGGSGRSKLLRKTAHALRQRGVSVLFQPAEERMGAGGSQRGFVGPIGPSGERCVVVSADRPGESSRDLLYAAIGDRKGLMMFEHGTVSARQERDLLDEWRDEESGMGFQEVSPEWAWEVLRRAYARSREAGCRVPEEFVLCRHQWELEGAGDGSGLVPRVEVSGDARERALASLAEKFPVELWEMDEELRSECARELGEVDASPLMLGSELTKERRERVFAKFAERLFEGARRSFFRQRLEETACFLLAGKRREDARVALAAAELLRDGTPIARNPFCLGFVRSRVEDWLEDQEPPESFIERPGAGRVSLDDLC